MTIFQRILTTSNDCLSGKSDFKVGVRIRFRLGSGVCGVPYITVLTYLRTSLEGLGHIQQIGDPWADSGGH